MEELSQLNQFLNDVSVEQKKARIEAAKIQKMKEEKEKRQAPKIDVNQSLGDFFSIITEARNKPIEEKVSKEVCDKYKTDAERKGAGFTVRASCVSQGFWPSLAKKEETSIIQAPNAFDAILEDLEKDVEVPKVKKKPITKAFTGSMDDLKIEEPPAIDSEETKKELRTIMSMMRERTKKLEQSIVNHDDMVTHEIRRYLVENDLDFVSSDISRLVEIGSQFARHFKDKFKRPRPYELAKKMKEFHYYKFGLMRFPSDSMKTPSYPSGHSLQSRLVAEHFIKKYPEHKDGLIKAADECGKGRVFAGWHFPSDHEAGIELAKQIYPKLDLSDNVQEQTDRRLKLSKKLFEESGKKLKEYEDMVTHGEEYAKRIEARAKAEIEIFATQTREQLLKEADEVRRTARLQKEEAEKNQTRLNTLQSFFHRLDKFDKTLTEKEQINKTLLVDALKTKEEISKELKEVKDIPAGHVYGQNITQYLPPKKELNELERMRREFNHFRRMVTQQMASIGGGGAVNLLDLDDIDTSSLGNGKFLVYNSTTGKLEFTDQVDGN